MYATNVDTFKAHIRNIVDRSILPYRQNERGSLMYLHVAPNIDVGIYECVSDRLTLCVVFKVCVLKVCVCALKVSVHEY